VTAPLCEAEIARELAALEIVLPPPALPQLSRYLELLVHWNRRINLTAIRDPKVIVCRLFGESLCIARAVELRGWLVDVGSGAGFPGLALKLVAPELRVTLIEARHKKCAFLKEVTRQCGFTRIEVVADRFEDWAGKTPGKADLITTRAVQVTPRLLQAMKRILAPQGKVVFLTTPSIASELQIRHRGWDWSRVQPVGMTDNSFILVVAQLTDKQ
jgi:16S rRNA (guanine527-N7)-methyltransferase